MVTGLLLLGASVSRSMDDTVDKAIDVNINYEEILPVNAPKLPYFTKDMQKTESDKKNQNQTHHQDQNQVKPRETPTNVNQEYCRKLNPAPWIRPNHQVVG